MGYIVNLAVEGRLAVVVGGGAVASRKVQDLLSANARVKVVAPRACDEVRALAEAGRIEAHWRAYEPGDLEGAFVAVAATGDEEVNARVSRDAQAAGVLVNVVDRPALCTFTLPATLRRGCLTLAVATEGRSPALAGVIREELEQRYGPEYAEVVELFAELRARMIEQGWDGPRIRQAVGEIYRAMAAGDWERVRELVRGVTQGNRNWPM